METFLPAPYEGGSFAYLHIQLHEQDLHRRVLLMYQRMVQVTTPGCVEGFTVGLAPLSMGR